MLLSSNDCLVPHAANSLQVWKIEDFLSKWEAVCGNGDVTASGSAAQDPGRAAIALVLLKEIDAYRCVALLAFQQSTLWSSRRHSLCIV